MQPWNIAALLILQCWIPFATCISTAKYTDVSSFNVVGTVDVKGSKLRVYEARPGVQIIEPRISFGNSCLSIRYNHLYQTYELSVPVSIEANTLGVAISYMGSPMTTTSSVSNVTITGLEVAMDKALESEKAQVMTMAQLEESGEAQLLFLCNTFVRCQQLRDEVASNPQVLWRAVKFMAFGRVDGSSIVFRAVKSANSPKLNCSVGDWVVFQKRVDGSLSFAQNWDAYVKGFGNPNSNYWMGLDKLFAMTVTSQKNTFSNRSRCELIIEMQDFNGKDYLGQYKLFQVLGPDENYRLRVGQEVSNFTFPTFLKDHNEMPFSTYDRDNDNERSSSCSRLYGFGGWWFHQCFSVNPNGAYTTDNNIHSDPTYVSAFTAGKFVNMRSTLMKFRCN